MHVTGVVLRQFGPMQPGQRCQVSLALQATALEVATQKGQQASEEVPPEAVEAFTQFWAAHAGCPLEGRNKVGGGEGRGLGRWGRRCPGTGRTAR